MLSVCLGRVSRWILFSLCLIVHGKINHNTHSVVLLPALKKNHVHCVKLEAKQVKLARNAQTRLVATRGERGFPHPSEYNENEGNICYSALWTCHLWICVRNRCARTPSSVFLCLRNRWNIRERTEKMERGDCVWYAERMDKRDASRDCREE